MFAHRFGLVVAAFLQQVQQAHRAARGHADRTRREALQAEVAVVDDGRAFADAADDPARIHGLQQGRQVRVLCRVVAHHGVLERDDAAFLDQARGGGRGQ
ncbi:hypothetical protein G6F64_015186 [Rhizopus arrhizus]|uniref:Secreted protein n=1 Tax=Rhizopus oryzae TaxID=64495 RepID=A0A9P6WS10_RHIOR|nr:hypothetical protein G6F64_015186 [Rhizopus arrhizus]